MKGRFMVMSRAAAGILGDLSMPSSSWLTGIGTACRFSCEALRSEILVESRLKSPAETAVPRFAAAITARISFFMIIV